MFSSCCTAHFTFLCLSRSMEVIPFSQTWSMYLHKCRTSCLDQVGVRGNFLSEYIHWILCTWSNGCERKLFQDKNFLQNCLKLRLILSWPLLCATKKEWILRFDSKSIPVTISPSIVSTYMQTAFFKALCSVLSFSLSELSAVIPC